MSTLQLPALFTPQNSCTKATKYSQLIYKNSHTNTWDVSKIEMFITSIVIMKSIMTVCVYMYIYVCTINIKRVKHKTEKLDFCNTFEHSL